MFNVRKCEQRLSVREMKEEYNFRNNEISSNYIIKREVNGNKSNGING